jgi:hypothetical protein
VYFGPNAPSTRALPDGLDFAVEFFQLGLGSTEFGPWTLKAPAHNETTYAATSDGAS